MNLRDAANICAPLGYQECDVCGRVARDVALRSVVKAQAGAGLAQTLQCFDVTPCWVRKEEQEKAKEAV